MLISRFLDDMQNICMINGYANISSSQQLGNMLCISDQRRAYFASFKLPPNLCQTNSNSFKDCISMLWSTRKEEKNWTYFKTKIVKNWCMRICQKCKSISFLCYCDVAIDHFENCSTQGILVADTSWKQWCSLHLAVHFTTNKEIKRQLTS